MSEIRSENWDDPKNPRYQEKPLKISAYSEKKQDIKTNTFIKIRIHSIMLERQVYLCSAEIIRRQPSQKDCTLLKHSNVTSLVKYTPPLISDLIDQLLRDIQ